jgi:hypothetical protein
MGESAMELRQTQASRTLMMFCPFESAASERPIPSAKPTRRHFMNKGRTQLDDTVKANEFVVGRNPRK